MQGSHKRMLLVVCLSAIVIGGGLAVAAYEKETWLPISKTEIVQIIAAGMGADSVVAFKPEKFIIPPRHNFIDRALAGKALFPPHDEVWLIPAKATPFEFAMAGKGERIHSLKLTVRFIDYSDKDWELTQKMLSNLYRAVFPDWSEADKWGLNSSRKSIDMTVLWKRNELDDPEKMYVNKTINGITISTFGTLSGPIKYVITTRKRCVLRFPWLKDNPLGGIICLIPYS